MKQQILEAKIQKLEKERSELIHIIQTHKKTISRIRQQRDLYKADLKEVKA